MIPVYPSSEFVNEFTKNSTSKQGAVAKKPARKTNKNSVAAKVGSQHRMLASAKTNLSALHEMAISVKMPGEDVYREYIGSKSLGVQLAVLGMIAMAVHGLAKCMEVDLAKFPKDTPSCAIYSWNCLMDCYIGNTNSCCKGCALSFYYDQMPTIVEHLFSETTLSCDREIHQKLSHLTISGTIIKHLCNAYDSMVGEKDR